MENAVEALKMAAAVLIFIIAIVSSFSLFGTAKETADSIIRIRDKQAYLQSADLDGGILYTSASEIRGDDYTEDKRNENSTIGGVTRNGDRLVKIEDIISTIYRYSSEKYGVTIMKSTGTIIARYDSNTEQIMNIWNTVDQDEYIKRLKEYTDTDYVGEPGFDKSTLEQLYAITVDSVGSIGAPWYGNETEIRKRIACDLKGETYTYNNQTYVGKNILNALDGASKIVEVTKEIDNSTYIEDGGNKTDLLQTYEMPTIEVIYIIL